MHKWLKYFNIQFPIPVYIFLVSGITLSSMSTLDVGLKFVPFLLSFIGLMIFFFELRLMDDLKDYQKDLVAHPERPLPSGLLRVDSVKNLVLYIFSGMILYGFMLFVVGFKLAALLYIGFSIYLWLMYKEFFLGSFWEKRVFTYGLTHQIILIPICIFPVAFVSSDLTLSFYYSLMVLGSFFSYEVARKLNPFAHPILGTYLTVYGKKRVIVIISCLSIFAMIFASVLNLSQILWPVSITLIASTSLLFINPQKYKLVEVVATLSLVFYIWTPLVKYLLKELI